MDVLSIKEELVHRLSMFSSAAQIHMWKCSADKARGPVLADDDDVYYLTWLIAYTEDAEHLPGTAAWTTTLGGSSTRA